MSALGRIPIIDVDTHYTEPRDLWTRSAPAGLRGRTMRVEPDQNGNERWVVDDGMVMAPLGFTVIRKDGSKLHGDLSLAHYEEMSEAATDPHARMQAMDELGVHAQILYPNALGFAGHAVMRIDDLALRNHCISGYNDGVAELQRISGGRLLPQAVIPFWDVKAAARELRRCREELGLTGFTMTDAPEQWELPALHDPYWDPIWDTAQGLGLPVNFHIGAGTPMAATTWGAYERGRMMAVMSVLLMMNNMRCLTNLIFCGLLDRFPALNFVSVESGAGWIPFVIEACEYQMDENMGPDQKAIALRPREYFRRQIYASYWFEKQGVGAAIEALGEDNLMFETDFPHPTCLYPEVRKQVEESLGAQPERVQRKVLYQTACRLYQIPEPPDA